MRLRYLLRRLLLLAFIIWTAATINFFIPKISPRNPVREKLAQEALRGGYLAEGMEQMIEAYEQKFGLDKPAWQQYLLYMKDIVRFDLGYSIAFYPKKVLDLIGEALPWTLGLLTVSTIIAFTFGSVIGALIAWPRAPKFFRVFVPSLVVLSAIPFYLLGLLLIYVLAFRWKLFPLGGGYGIGTIPGWNLDFIGQILRHAMLPALSIVLAQAGGWAIGMRGMMVTVEGEDYMNFAEAKGLKDSRIFFRYGVRNALLPQVTSLALALGYIVSGAVLVELVFGYPGIGTLLVRSISSLDYFVIYGVVFVLIVAIGVALLLIDLIYPLLDPRIKYGE